MLQHSSIAREGNLCHRQTVVRALKRIRRYGRGIHLVLMAACRQKSESSARLGWVPRGAFSDARLGCDATLSADAGGARGGAA